MAGKPRNRPTNVRTSVYLEGSRVNLLEFEGMARDLRRSGYAVVSEWHDAASVYIEAPVQIEFARLAAADMMIVQLAGALAKTYTLIGFASACGLRIVAVGNIKQLSKDVRGLFVMHAETWEELAEHEFLKLGSARWKKLKGVNK